VRGGKNFRVGFRPEIDPGTPLDRPGPPRTSICTKNQPQRPTLRPNGGERKIQPGGRGPFWPFRTGFRPELCRGSAKIVPPAGGTIFCTLPTEIWPKTGPGGQSSLSWTEPPGVSKSRCKLIKQFFCCAAVVQAVVLEALCSPRCAQVFKFFFQWLPPHRRPIADVLPLPRLRVGSGRLGQRPTGSALMIGATGWPVTSCRRWPS